MGCNQVRITIKRSGEQTRKFSLMPGGEVVGTPGRGDRVGQEGGSKVDQNSHLTPVEAVEMEGR